MPLPKRKPTRLPLRSLQRIMPLPKRKPARLPLRSLQRRMPLPKTHPRVQASKLASRAARMLVRLHRRSLRTLLLWQKRTSSASRHLHCQQTCHWASLLVLLVVLLPLLAVVLLLLQMVRMLHRSRGNCCPTVPGALWDMAARKVRGLRPCRDRRRPRVAAACLGLDRPQPHRATACLGFTRCREFRHQTRIVGTLELERRMQRRAVRFRPRTAQAQRHRLASLRQGRS
mmetsp:Transcript_60056/g.196044  ORF Transcript_60056/g.196044 Transcript_60056/m.196044 type:complete len:229 (+) Transcript_60056:197-883(+)